MREALFSKYNDFYSQGKVLNFAKGFLRYQAKLTFDQRYLAFDLFLEKPKVRKVSKKMTARIVTKSDVERVLSVINQEKERGFIDELHARQFSGLVMFGAYTGQRPYSTIVQLRVEQLREALRLAKPVVHVEPMQDKIRMEHFVPLHPQVVEATKALCRHKNDESCIFMLESFRKWTQTQKIPLIRCGGHFTTSDLRKFAEQQGDIIGWNESNRAYVLTHGVRGVEWSHYRHPLPDTSMMCI